MCQLMLLTSFRVCWSYQLGSKVLQAWPGLCLPSPSSSTKQVFFILPPAHQTRALSVVSHPGAFQHVLFSLLFLCFSFPGSFLLFFKDGSQTLPLPWSHEESTPCRTSFFLSTRHMSVWSSMCLFVFLPHYTDYELLKERVLWGCMSQGMP